MGKFISTSKALAVECLAPDLPIIYRQCCCLSDYLPNERLGFFFGGGVDYVVDSFSDLGMWMN